MKKTYLNPNISIEQIILYAPMLAGSWKTDEQGGVNPTPGTQDDFGAKDELEDTEFYGW